MTFLSTLSLRRATRAGSDQRHSPDISIYALLAESDHHRSTYQHQGRHFYPRSPCGERRKPRRLKSRLMVFLSTLSLRRATRCQFNGDNGKIFLSTLSLRRATKSQSSGAGIAKYFYPRSPCGERPRRDSRQHPAGEFLSTLSLRRATAIDDYFAGRNDHFYPRSPCGERLTSNVVIRDSTYISIHALLAESDRKQKRASLHRLYFYPRSPCGERPMRSDFPFDQTRISIHALLAESDCAVTQTPH